MLRSQTGSATYSFQWVRETRRVGGSSPLRRNHPNKAVFCMVHLITNFVVKHAMFNLNENNRIVMSQHPADMRMGVNCLGQ